MPCTSWLKNDHTQEGKKLRAVGKPFKPITSAGLNEKNLREMHKKGSLVA